MVDLARKILARSPSLRVLNHYGPAEATVGVATFEVTQSFLASCNHHSVPIGKALSGTRMAIADEAGNELRRGVVGEIVISGRQVAYGYVGLDPSSCGGGFEETATQNRRYRTGDFGVQYHSGEVLFLSRRDSQSKVRGMKVDLMAVEAVVKMHPKIREVLMLPWRISGGSDFACVYVSERRLPEDSLRREIGEALGPFAVPARFLWLSTLPLTRNGKLDMSQIEAGLAGRGSRNQERALSFASDSLESRLMAIWEELLGVPVTNLDDDFFLAGGNSLLATQMVARIRKELGVDLPLTEFFDHSKFAAMVAAIQRHDSRLK